MAPKPQTAPGLNQAEPKRLIDDLSRRYAVMNRAALRVVISDVLPAAVEKDRGRLAEALEKLQTAVDESLPEDKIEKEAQRVGEQVDSNHRRLFFIAAAMVMGVKVIGTDAPGEELGIEEITKISPMAIGRNQAIGPKGIGKTAKVFAPPTGRRVKPSRVMPRVNFEPNLLVDRFVRENVKYVSKLREGVRRAVGDQVIQGIILPDGEPERLAREIRERWEKDGVPSRIPTKRATKDGKPVDYSLEKHSRMIADDQIAKLNGALNASRQTAAGIKRYVWETRKDERVRMKHRELQGQAFNWEEGAQAPGGNIWPGQEPRCRCWGRALTDGEEMIPNFIDLDDPEFRGTIKFEPTISSMKKWGWWA